MLVTFSEFPNLYQGIFPLPHSLLMLQQTVAFMVRLRAVHDLQIVGMLV